MQRVCFDLLAENDQFSIAENKKVPNISQTGKCIVLPYFNSSCIWSREEPKRGGGVGEVGGEGEMVDKAICFNLSKNPLE